MMAVAFWLIFYVKNIHKFVTGKLRQYNLDTHSSCMPLLCKQKNDTLILFAHGLVN